MLLSKYNEELISNLLNENIIKIRKWHDGPGEMIVPTDKGLKLYKKNEN